MKFPPTLFDTIVQYAIEASPDECCGMIGSRNGEPMLAIPITNVAEIPSARYEMDPAEQLVAYETFEVIGLVLGAIYHSHPCSPPYPSLTDVQLALCPDVVYVIVSLMDGPGWPRVRAFEIVDGSITEQDVLLGVTG